MKNIKKVSAAAMSVLFMGYLAVPAFAEAEPSEKEEVIYIMTDAFGNVTDMEAVNIFSGGDITDYGDYSAVKMLNTTDSITQDGNKVTFSSDSDKVYYQGTMKNTEIPWNISIRYFMDGKEYSAEDIAGKSGALEIHFTVTKNENCSGSFYEDYALQASFTFDTDICKNIVGSGATIANVGGDKQLTYTILPDKGIDTVIKADVTDFEVDSAAINGVRLNMDFNVDDSELKDKVDELVSAVDKLNDGASEVRDGAGELYDATGTLNDKVGELNSGVGSLTDGAGELSSGLTSITEKNGQLTDAAYTAYEGLCTDASAALNNQLQANGFEPITLTPSDYSDVLGGLLRKTDADSVYKEAYQTAQREVTKQVEAQADELYLGYIRSQADSVYPEYVTSQSDAIYAQAASQAVKELTDEEKAQILDSAAAQLTDEQKEQIIQGVAASLTNEQKAEIREAYIRQMMISEDVTSQIEAATAAADDAAKQINDLKGQLDSYGEFYRGLIDYTDAVGGASEGADMLKMNMDTLYSNTGTLEVSVSELNDAVGELYDGTKELADGTSEFVDKTSDMDTQISDEIDSMTSSIFGSDAEVVSFVSDKNTNVDSVQFVIKTAAVEKAETAASAKADEAPLTFWQKLLRLFGLY